MKSKSSFVVVGRRFNPSSPHTHHFAFSRNKIVASHTFKIIDFASEKEAIIQILILNSSITYSNILMLREQTTGDYTDIMETELYSFDIFNFDALNSQDIVNLERLFNDLKDKNFPSIVEQYTTDNELRRNLGSILLEILGYNKFEILNFG